MVYLSLPFSKSIGEGFSMLYSIAENVLALLILTNAYKLTNRFLHLYGFLYHLCYWC